MPPSQHIRFVDSPTESDMLPVASGNSLRETIRTTVDDHISLPSLATHTRPSNTSCRSRLDPAAHARARESVRSALSGRSAQKRDHDSHTHSSRKGAMFVDKTGMKETVRKALCKPPEDLYFRHGVWQAIVRSETFDRITLVVIALNAAWLSIEADLNSAPVISNAHAGFQIVEHCFTVFFCFEWIVKFMSFKRKRDALKDASFIFDSVLVAGMVFDSWIMTLTIVILQNGMAGSGSPAILGIGKLLRLLRMARMARLLRAMPEMMIMIKGMAAACRSVFFTLCLLGVALYVFGIAFRQLADGLPIGEKYFSSVPQAAYTLMMHGCFLDSLSLTARAIADDSHVIVVLFWIFVLISSLTILNMLIGVLCEVVSAVAAAENETRLVAFIKGRILQVLTEIDEDGNSEISRDEFIDVLSHKDACIALQESGVDVLGLVDSVELIFDEDDTALSFETFMETVLQLRGCNNATVKDIMDLRKFIRQIIREDVANSLREQQQMIRRIEHKVNKLVGMAPNAEEDPVAKLSKLSFQSDTCSTGTASTYQGADVHQLRTVDFEVVREPALGEEEPQDHALRHALHYDKAKEWISAFEVHLSSQWQALQSHLAEEVQVPTPTPPRKLGSSSMEAKSQARDSLQQAKQREHSPVADAMVQPSHHPPLPGSLNEPPLPPQQQQQQRPLKSSLKGSRGSATVEQQHGRPGLAPVTHMDDLQRSLQSLLERIAKLRAAQVAAGMLGTQPLRASQPSLLSRSGDPDIIVSDYCCSSEAENQPLPSVESEWFAPCSYHEIETEV